MPSNAELDETWAVLGEVYGEGRKLRELGIRVRRIRSTLDDLAEFRKTVTYVPELARFRTSDAKILKLMVGPLYNEDPSYGVRELLQNAIDACLEREDS
jgi:molecular chaperone HtpG